MLAAANDNKTRFQRSPFLDKNIIRKVRVQRAVKSAMHSYLSTVQAMPDFSSPIAVFVISQPVFVLISVFQSSGENIID